MKKLFALAALTLALGLSSCASGPHQTFRSVDDWDHDLYVSKPRINGLLTFIPVIPLAKYGALIVDFFVVDAYAFWFKDVWDDKGTAFDHNVVGGTDGSMGSLITGDGEFLKITY